MPVSDKQTTITVPVEVRAMLSEIAADESKKREVRVSVPELLRLIAVKIKNGEVEL